MPITPPFSFKTDNPYGLKLALRATAARINCTGTTPFSMPAEGSEVTVATITGSGCLTKFWFTTADPLTGWYGRLRIYVDGQVSADTDLELGTLFQTIGGTDLTRNAQTEHWQGIYRYGGQQMGIITFPVPYANGCIVKIQNPTGSGISPGSQIFTNVYSTPDVSSPLRFHGTQVDWAHSTFLASTDTFDFLNLGSGAGYVVFHILSQDSLNALTSLERNYRFYRNGEGSPSFETSGTEDFFLDCYYWGADVTNGHTPPTNSLAASYIYRRTETTDFDGLRIYAARDLLSDLGGLRFSNGGILRWNNDGQIPGNDVFVRHTTLYYLGA